MSSVVVDTHTIIWYFLNSEKLSEAARDAIEMASQVYIASISLVEMIYLNEKRKISDIALQRLRQALNDPDTRWLVAALDTPTAQSTIQVPRDIVPEMPDRIIAATALYLNLPLVTRDSKIQSSTIQTIW